MTPMRRYRFPSVDMLLIALAAIVGVIAVAGVVLAILAYGKINPTIQAIQAERARNVRANCLDTNGRHDRTIATLDRRLQVAVRRADRTRDRALRVQGCIRSLTDRAEGIQRDGDLEAFLREAAAARRMDHRFAVARRYELIAHRAHRRQLSARRRMLGADPRVNLIAVTAGPACRAEYPRPSLLPF
jgi:hypothetical protein